MGSVCWSKKTSTHAQLVSLIRACRPCTRRCLVDPATGCRPHRQPRTEKQLVPNPPARVLGQQPQQPQRQYQTCQRYPFRAEGVVQTQLEQHRDTSDTPKEGRIQRRGPQDSRPPMWKEQVLSPFGVCSCVTGLAHLLPGNGTVSGSAW